MGRSREQTEAKRAKRVVVTRQNLASPDEPTISTATNSQELGGNGGKKDTKAQSKAVKLTDIPVDAFSLVHAGQIVNVTDNEVYADNVFIGRIPKREGAVTGTKKLNKVLPSKGEIWINI